MSDHDLYWLVMPAAGVGQRMGADIPKQYLPLAGRTVIEWALQPFLADAACQGVMLALSADDQQWRTLPLAADDRIRTTIGGATRADSVLAGLKALRLQGADSNDWVLVHDAARPCLPAQDLHSLLACAEDEGVGALLAMPVADTLKRAAADGRVAETVSRAQLWRAQTPQMFRLSLLMGALQDARAQQRQVTDEASAVEALGLMPRLIAGSPDNIKVTLPADLPLAERLLQYRLQHSSTGS